MRSTATDGRSALLLTLDEPPDLIILDIGLPEMDGLEVCRRVRDVAPGACRSLMLTARDAELDAVSGLDAGADDYVTKPFRLAELLARVRRMLRRASTARAVRRPTASRSTSPRAARGATSASSS